MTISFFGDHTLNVSLVIVLSDRMKVSKGSYHNRQEVLRWRMTFSFLIPTKTLS